MKATIYPTNKLCAGDRKLLGHETRLNGKSLHGKSFVTTK